MKKIDLLCVIDDDPIYTFLIKRVIDEAEVSLKSIFFKNGREALNYFTEHKDDSEKLPQLVLVDINMPILDGWQFMDGFAALATTFPKNITVYISSSSTDEDDFQRALETPHVLELIPKPISSELLRELVVKLES
jgi:CheY-like chemotaxis protein